MPTLRAFRALRYEPVASTDLSAVICPPYDVISPEQRATFAARDPRNAVHVELPEGPAGDADARYREAARLWVRWRTDGTLRKDRTPSLYVYEQRYAVPGSTARRTQRGFFARLKLEPLEHGHAVRPHERTLTGPKEDRLKLLRACGTNLSPIVALYAGADGRTRRILDELTARPADASATDDEGTEHRLWAWPMDHAEAGGALDELLRHASAEAVTIADGHHRYETALHYREERGRNRACESDPAYDYVLCLLYDTRATELTVLPTHRVVRGQPAGEELLSRADELFHVERCASPEEVVGRLSALEQPSLDASALGTGRFGAWTGGTGAVLHARDGAFDQLLDEGVRGPLRGLDVVVLAAALERLLGIDARAVASGDRVSYTKDAREAVERVARGEADSAFLLDPTPVHAVTAVAAEGLVMPQKSTYFYPKAATGLVFNPLES